MWEVVSLLLSVAAIILILNYMSEPKKLFEDIRELKASNHKIEQLEERIAVLEAAVLEKNTNKPD